MEGRPKERISKTSGHLMIGVAVFLDLISIIPGADWVSDIASAFIFPFWFSVHGVSFLKNSKMLKGSIIIFLIELIPFVSILPALSFGVIKNILSIQKEDRNAIAAWEKKMAAAQTKNQADMAARSLAYNQNNSNTTPLARIGQNTSDSRRVDSIRRAA